MKALKIENRKVTLTDIPNGTPDEELHALQNEIGGYIEVVRISEDAALIVDEEGLLKVLCQNALASLVARQQIVTGRPSADRRDCAAGRHGCQCRR